MNSCIKASQMIETICTLQEKPDGNYMEQTFNESYLNKITASRASAHSSIFDTTTFLEVVDSEIKSCIAKNADTPLAQMALKHFEVKGKMIRPMFIAELAHSLKLDLSMVLDWAVSCELLHNATLVHDDLQDGDEVRRGAPSLWKQFGAEQAINIGDYLLIIAPRPIILGTNENKEQLLDLFTRMSSGVVAGQVNEFELNKMFSCENLMASYLKCIGGKTSTLFSCLALGVALIAKESMANAMSIESIFFQLGHIFQIQDDILDLYGNKQRGELGCDIKEGKISYLIVTHLEENPRDFEFVSNILKTKRSLTTDKDVQAIIDLFKEKKTIDTCIKNLELRVSNLLSVEYLQTNPKLKDLIQKLVDKVLLPIKDIKE